MSTLGLCPQGRLILSPKSLSLIHISDLDVVLIHLTDVTVKPGEHVIAGVTPMAKIRDIFQYLDESLQLKNYTAVNDNGNHTHIQVNNANHPEYHGLDDLKPQAAAPSDGVTPTTDA